VANSGYTNFPKLDYMLILRQRDNAAICGKESIMRRMQSSTMLRRVALVRTDVSEERIAPIIRMERIKRARNNVSSNQQLKNVAAFSMVDV
jgi:hypothetical protein